MTQIFIFTAGNQAARSHLDDSIRTPISASKVFQHLPVVQHDEFREIERDDGGFFAWGAEPGKYDRFISSKLGYEIAEKLPNANLEIIDKSGHDVHMDKPMELVRVVTTFLDDVA